jgi:hypothetical protein
MDDKMRQTLLRLAVEITDLLEQVSDETLASLTDDQAERLAAARTAISTVQRAGASASPFAGAALEVVFFEWFTVLGGIDLEPDVRLKLAAARALFTADLPGGQQTLPVRRRKLGLDINLANSGEQTVH